MSIKVRYATLRDSPGSIAVFQELAEEYGSPSPISTETVKAYLASPSDFLLVAEREGQFAGLLSYSIRRDLWSGTPCCYIEQIAVLKPLRGLGIGTALLETILKKGRDEGYGEITLTVEKENRRARALYRRMGFDQESICLEMEPKQ